MGGHGTLHGAAGSFPVTPLKVDVCVLSLQRAGADMAIAQALKGQVRGVAGLEWRSRICAGAVEVRHVRTVRPPACGQAAEGRGWRFHGRAEVSGCWTPAPRPTLPPDRRASAGLPRADPASIGCAEVSAAAASCDRAAVWRTSPHPTWGRRGSQFSGSGRYSGSSQGARTPRWPTKLRSLETFGRVDGRASARRDVASEVICVAERASRPQPALHPADVSRVASPSAPGHHCPEWAYIAASMQAGRGGSTWRRSDGAPAAAVRRNARCPRHGDQRRNRQTRSAAPRRPCVHRRGGILRSHRVPGKHHLAKQPRSSTVFLAVRPCSEPRRSDFRSYRSVGLMLSRMPDRTTAVAVPILSEPADRSSTPGSGVPSPLLGGRSQEVSAWARGRSDRSPAVPAGAANLANTATLLPTVSAIYLATR